MKLILHTRLQQCLLHTLPPYAWRGLHSDEEMNTEFRSAYTLGAVLGSGQFGKVVKVKRNQDGVELAAKLIRVSRCPAWSMLGIVVVCVIFAVHIHYILFVYVHLFA